MSHTFPIYLFVALALLSVRLSANEDPYYLEPRLNDDPDFQYTPSPEDWRDINVYQIFTDRFYDGDSSNNNARTMRAGTGWYGEQTEGKSWYNTGNSSNANERHLAQGGDWEGLRQKIPYLKSMGVKSVWISSVQKTEQGVDKRYTPYHAYHPTDYYRVEPLFGDFAKLKQTIDELHANGMYVILDVVPNHLADLAGLGSGLDDYYQPNGGNLFWWDGTRHAPPFDRLDWIHSNGKIVNYDAYPETQLGAFVGTDDLATERQDVQDALEAAFKNLIDATDCDGFRVDAIKHVDHQWIKNWASSMRAHAAYRGKDNFIIFGELFSFDDGFHAAFTRDEGSGFNSAMWFSMMNTLKSVFAESGATSSLTGPLNNVHNNYIFGEGTMRTITFMDNHDVDRIALNYSSESWRDMLRPAVGLLYTAAPVPTLLYGTEHGFNQGGRENRGIQDGDYQRENMMDYGYQWGNAQGDKFSAPSEIKDLIGTLNQAREQYICLRRGSFQQRWETGGRGIYAFTRAYDDQEALVVLNTDWDNWQNCNPEVSKPDGTTFTNVLDTNETLTVSGGRLDISMPTRGLKVFVAGDLINPPIRISNTRQWPLQGNISSATEVYIDADTAPKGSAVSGEVITSTDGGNNWTAHSLVRNPDFDTDDTDAWNANLGTFSGDAAVLYAVNFTDDEGETSWDSNAGENYSFTVNTDVGPRLDTVENTGTAPGPGELDAGENLVITTQSSPKGLGQSGRVVYNDGSGWNDAALVADGSNATHDLWKVDLGSFAAEKTIQFAVMVSDGGNPAIEVWDNNSGGDYLITVNPEIQLPVTKPNLEFVPNGNGFGIRGRNLKAGDQYIIEWSDDLSATDWNHYATFSAASESELTLDESEMSAMQEDHPKAFFRMRYDEGTVVTPVLNTSLVTTGNTALEAGENVTLSAETQDAGAVSEVYVVYNTDPNAAGDWPSASFMKISTSGGKDQWSVDLGNTFPDGSTLYYAVRFVPADGGDDVWQNNGGNNFTVTIGDIVVPPAPSTTPYSTNPTLGQSVANGSITADGANNGEWDDSKLIAVDMANDDPRTIGSNWTMHEAPMDLTHLWAAWDDNYLYLAWQYVDITDVVDPSNAGSAGGSKISNNDGILQWLALDTGAGGASLDMWGKNDGQAYWTGSDLPDIQIYLAGSLWQGYLSRAVDGVFPVDDGGINYFNLKVSENGVTFGKGDLFAAGSLLGVGDADDRYNAGAPDRDFLVEGHSTSRDAFFEIALPLNLLQISRAQLENDGIGVMIGVGSESAMDSIPHDETTLDTSGVEVWNSSFEWGDVDSFTSDFARIGSPK